MERALLTRPKVVDGADPPLRALLTGANLLLTLRLLVLPALLVLGGGFLGFLRLGHDRFIVVGVAAEAVVLCVHGRGVVLALGAREHGGFRLCDFFLHLGQSLELGPRVRPSLLHNRRHARRLFLHPVLLWRARNYSAEIRPGRFLLLPLIFLTPIAVLALELESLSPLLLRLRPSFLFLDPGLLFLLFLGTRLLLSLGLGLLVSPALSLLGVGLGPAQRFENRVEAGPRARRRPRRAALPHDRLRVVRRP